MAVNIFLRQFRTPVAELANEIRSCQLKHFDVEHLEALKLLLPDAAEVSTSLAAFERYI